MPAEETQIEREILQVISEITEKIDKDQQELAQFYVMESEKSKRFLGEEDFYLITRILSKADYYVNLLSGPSKKAIYNILKEHKCKSDPRLLTSMAVLRYMLNSFISNEEYKFNKDTLSRLIKQGFYEFNKFKVMW
jgi:hypothetical protein